MPNLNQLQGEFLQHPRCNELLHLHSENEMNEKVKYKRYMVFTWCEYDNHKPFENVDGSFDSLGDAISFLNGSDLLMMNEEDGTPLYCIFDRIEGCMCRP